MTKFTEGDKVIVKSFTATVSAGVESGGAGRPRRQVQDTDGAYHYICENQLEKALPYKDGVDYIDALDERFTFHAYTLTLQAPGWVSSSGNGIVFEIDYPERPLREVGPAIVE